jgi:hypothetical protein
VGLPSLRRGLTTKWLASLVPVGAQPTTPVMPQRVEVISPENSGLASEPTPRPLVLPLAFCSVTFCSAMLETMLLSSSGSLASM